MATGLNIDFSDFTNAALNIGVSTKVLEEAIDNVLNTAAVEIETAAKLFAPTDEGALKGSITANVSKHLLKEINVNVPYAAYIEFGTGRYAAAYVSSLPPDWQTYAAQFRGKGGNGTLDEFLERMVQWVLRKGLQDGGKRSKKGKDSAYNIAYVVVIRILRHGIKPHPFLYPAYEQQRKKIIADTESVIQEFKA